MAVWDESTYTTERTIAPPPLTIESVREATAAMRDARVALERQAQDALRQALGIEVGGAEALNFFRILGPPMALSSEFRRTLKFGESTICVEGS